MNSMLAVQLPDTYEGTLLLGFQVFIIGMATVFAVLILIWGILSLFNRFSKRGAGGKETTLPAVSTAPATASAAAGDELIAVIAAAIAMAENENPGMKFRVVSFRRK